MSKALTTKKEHTFQGLVEGSFKLQSKGAVVDALLHQMRTAIEAELPAAFDKVHAAERVIETELRRYEKSLPWLAALAKHTDLRIKVELDDNYTEIGIRGGEHRDKPSVDITLELTPDLEEKAQEVKKAQTRLSELQTKLAALDHHHMRRRMEQSINSKLLRKALGESFEASVKRFFDEL